MRNNHVFSKGILTSVFLCYLSFSYTLARHDDDEKITADGKRIYTTTEINTVPPRIDGVLDDACWQQEGYWSGNYLQQIPEEGAPPSQETQLKILYDEENIYVAIRAYDDEPGKIDRQMGRRDAFAGDIVGICFDSYFDHRTGFEFDLSAAGSKIDLMLLNDHWDTSWDAVWDGKVGIEDSAWTAEMRIPLSQLRYGNKEVHTWGLHAWRWINRNMEEDQWNLIPRDNPGTLYSIGELRGIKGITKARRMEWLPYVLGMGRTYEKDADNPFATGKQTRFTAGLDGKIGITSDFTLDLTINPDFGQVEADPAVLNLSAFEIYFRERRPFFLEGKNIMEFDLGGDQLFYSRRIGHPPMCPPELDDGAYAEQVDYTTILGALKFTGKSKQGLSVGVMESLTSRETARVSEDGETSTEIIEPFTNYFVGRVQQDFDKGNTMLGGIVTATNRWLDNPNVLTLNRDAYTGGVDFRHFWMNKTFSVDVKGVYSYIRGDPRAMIEMQQSSARYYQRPDMDYARVDTAATHLAGHGGEIEIGKGANGKWRYHVEFNWRSPGLELNDVGFLQLSDWISQGVSGGYVETEPIWIFRSYSVRLGQTNIWNYNRDYLGSSASLYFHSTFKNKWGFSASVMRQGRECDMRLLRGGPAVFVKGFVHNRYEINTDYSKKLSLRLGYHFHFFDDQISSVSDISPGITYRITDALRLSLDLDYQLRKDNLQYVAQEQYEEEDRYILATLDRKTMGFTMRLDYAITPELTIQYYGNPYVSAGKYFDYKCIIDPSSQSYAALYHIMDGSDMMYDEAENIYCVDENHDGEINYAFDNPDFNFRQFRSNLVARWEYMPGSTLFFVWTHGRSQYEESSDFTLRSGFQQLFDVHADNVFMIKLNYWLAI